ncbi:MAG: SDR family oxidoreductase [Myxococcales bacterium]|nr:SDR family oxidoreductase [Myxococcales bacterium]
MLAFGATVSGLMPKLYVVTGAASGIGLQLTRDLIAARHSVVAADLNLSGLESRAEEHGLLPKSNGAPTSSGSANGSGPAVWLRRLDVRSAADWDALLNEVSERLGVPDAVLNVAGYIRPGFSHKNPVELIDTTIDVNLKGVMHGTNAAARIMLPAGRGHIVNIASLAGIAAVPGIAAYSASKHGVRGFTLAVERELAPHGISVTVVCPGLVDTPMLDAQVDHDEAAYTFSGTRALTTEEISSAILKALETKPLELILSSPFSAQGVMSKLVNTFPGLASVAEPLIKRMGRRQQAKLKKSGR